MVEHGSKDIEAIRYLLVEDPVVLVDVSDVSVFFVGPFSREFGLLVNAVKWSSESWLYGLNYRLLLVHFANDTVNGIFRGFTVAVYQTIRISIEVLRGYALFFADSGDI